MFLYRGDALSNLKGSLALIKLFISEDRSDLIVVHILLNILVLGSKDFLKSS